MTQSGVGVNTDLYNWATKELPLWQQVSLVYISEEGIISETHLETLKLVIRTTAIKNLISDTELPSLDQSKLPALEAKHFAKLGKEDPVTYLGSIGPVKNLDRLSDTQPPLRFCANGITVVYGPNGSGKSGYCRIAKKICRSHKQVSLRGDAYKSGEEATPQIEITYQVKDQKKVPLTYLSDNPAPEALSKLSVFDSDIAAFYIDQERKISFLPDDLDKLRQLTIRKHHGS